MSFGETAALLVVLAFVCEFIDSSLGMGYGTTLTPLLMIMGYQPLQIVPSILLSEMISGITAGVFHHRRKNVNFRAGARDFNIAAVMSACSVAGAVFAVLVAIKISQFHLKLYIALVVTAMGIIILAAMNRIYRFKWWKIVTLGTVAAFNKGMSGGGYGPLVTSGQIIAGVNSKNAVGITSLAEGVNCMVGVIAYYIVTNHSIEWKLAPYLILGSLLSVPMATLAVKKINPRKFKFAVGLASLALGLFTLYKTIF